MGLLDHLPRGVSLGFPGLATFLGFWGWKFLGLFFGVKRLFFFLKSGSPWPPFPPGKKKSLLANWQVTIFTRFEVLS